MNDRWAKYKKYINLSQIKEFRVEKWKPPKDGQPSMMYTGNLKMTEKKPWVLYADHEAIDSFKSKKEASQVAADIINGNYDVK